MSAIGMRGRRKCPPDCECGRHRGRRRGTQCKWGHELTPENTYTYPSGARQCRECRRQQNGYKGNLPSAERTQCPQGHPYDEENTRYDKKGHRVCRECKQEIDKRALRKKVDAGLCIKCGKQPALPNNQRCKRCTAVDRERQQQRRQKLRTEVLRHYGAYCACCGETQDKFLTIDHVNNDGAAHRRMIRKANICSWLRRKDYPSGFQVLCYNCNCARGFYGKCPHEEKS